MTRASSNSENEFSRPVDRNRMGDGQWQIEAGEAERAALAKRFGLVSIERLEADLTLTEDGEAVTAKGMMHAAFVQSCAVSGDDLPVTVEEPIAFRFVPTGTYDPDEEIELSEEDCDAIEYAGSVFDLGEAVAQSLALAIDPYATGPHADRARKDSGLLNEQDTGPFAVLKGLIRE